MYSGGTRTKSTRLGDQSSAATVTTSSSHTGTQTTPTPSGGSHKTPPRKVDTGVADPREAQRIIDDARAEIGRSHRRNVAAIDRMTEPFRKYVQQKDLVAELAKSRKQCESYEKALKFQRNENNKLPMQLAMYEEKEAVEATTVASLDPTAAPPRACVLQAQNQALKWIYPR